MPGPLPTVTIRPAVPEDLDAVTSLLTGVFAADPLMSAITAAAPDPYAALDHLHRVELSTHYLDPQAPAVVDLAVDAEDRILGTALWDAPRQETGTNRPLPDPEELPEGLDLEVLGDAWELIRLDAALCESASPRDPHWYLYMIAVAPGARDTGTGAALLRRGLERVDAQGTVAHLEATTRRAASFYGRHGFVDSAILNSEGRLPDYWAMTRPKRRQH